MSIRNKIVLVPFPFDDLSATKVRPALCLTDELSIHNHIIIAFISSKIPEVINSSDILIDRKDSDFHKTGLKVDSVIVLHKLITISANLIIAELGILTPKFQEQINNNLKHIFNL